MQLLLDHISATIIGGSVLLILVVSQMRSGSSAVDQTSYYASKTHMINLTEMFESDFKNVGLGVPPGTAVFTEVGDNITSFLMLLDPDDPSLSTVSYQVLPADTITIDDEQVPLYEVQRLVNGTRTGATPARLLSFVLELRDVEGNPVTDTDDTEIIHVRYTMAMPFDPDGSYLPRTHWSRTFLAPNL